MWTSLLVTSLRPQPASPSFSGSASPLAVKPPLARRTEETWAIFPHARDPEDAALRATIHTYGPAQGEAATPAHTPPVVFLHGLVGLNEHWEDLIAYIRHRCECLAFELPLLEFPMNECSIEHVTVVTERFLRERFPGGCIVVGNSFGGHVALRLAIQQPQLIKGLVLAGSSGLIEKSIVSTIEIRPTKKWLRSKIEELYFDPSCVREQDLDRAFASLSKRGGARAMIKLSRSARKDVLRKQIHAIRCPTLVVWGKQDVVTPPEAGESFAKLIPGARIIWIDQCGHVPMAEGTQPFAAGMLEFLASAFPAPGQ